MKYFLHDTNAIDDEKVSELFMEFGYEGVGLFYVLLEKIGKQEKPIKTQVLKKQLKVGKKLQKSWDFMEKIGLICSNNGDTFNKQLLNFSEKYKIKKENNAKRISEWRGKQVITENVTHSEFVRNTPKVKVSKVKVDKEEYNSLLDVDFEKKPTLYQSLVELWLKELHIGWTFTAGHGKALKSMISKTKEVLKSHGRQYEDADVFSFLKMVFENLPEWYKEKDLQTINSKYNEIIAEIKTQNKSIKNGNTASNARQHSSVMYRS